MSTMIYKIDTLNTYSLEKLKEIAEKLSIDVADDMEKKALVYKIIDRSAEVAVSSATAQASARKKSAAEDKPAKARRRPKASLFEDEAPMEQEGEALIFISGSAESYGEFGEPDGLKIALNGIDYGWDGEYALDGNELAGLGKSIILPINLNIGENNLHFQKGVI